ncbi:GNAT family N-acetyltransferase [Geminicoccaceae bacterium 1502E]|nr:GNAT family N-acetyltransferase [Geminicoccaceae bacterium 1502E]
MAEPAGRRRLLATREHCMIRPALEDDLPRIVVIVRAAYARYLLRMDRLPGPMLDDYRARIAEGVVDIVEDGGTVAGIVVLLEKAGHLLLDNVAVDPAFQGRGLGRALLAHAEAEARRRGHTELRLYTHETMAENVELYRSLGYEETHRVEEDGYRRVYMNKRL